MIHIFDYILKNSYTKFGGQLYKQINGIPQGNNASPLIADLTLLAMETQFILNNRNKFHKNKFTAARYMDDIFIMTDSIETFLDDCNGMYDTALSLDRTNQTYDECNFLDLTVMVKNMVITTKLYNKTDDYQFSILKYPFNESNVHINLTMNTIHGEITRFYRCCSNKDDFIQRCKGLVSTLLHNKHTSTHIRDKVFKTIAGNKSLRHKFDLTDVNNIRLQMNYLFS